MGWIADAYLDYGCTKSETDKRPLERGKRINRIVISCALRRLEIVSPFFKQISIFRP